jgi:hypothetical protein
MRPNAATTRAYAAEHLAYEVEMALSLVDSFRQFARVLDVVGRNAYVEAFALHARNITAFLYARKPKQDDCVAEDYFANRETWPKTRPARPAALKPIGSRASAEVAHLSYERKDPSDPWDFEAIGNGLAAVLRVFVDSADEDRLGAPTHALLDRFLTEYAGRRHRRFATNRTSSISTAPNTVVPNALMGFVVGATEAVTPTAPLDQEPTNSNSAQSGH